MARREVERRASALLGQGDVERFVTGGQRGVDQWAAAWALAQGRPFEILLPYPVERFTEKWSADERAELERLLNGASEVKIIDPDGTRGSLAFDQRNERIVSRSYMLVVIWTAVRHGGTLYTLCAAWEAGCDVEEAVLPGATGAVLPGRGI